MYSHLDESTIRALYSAIEFENRFKQDFFVMQKDGEKDICTNDIEKYRKLGYKVRFRVHRVAFPYIP